MISKLNDHERLTSDEWLILIPTRRVVVLPGAITPLSIKRKSSLAGYHASQASERPLGFVLQRDPSRDEPGPDDLLSVGTAMCAIRSISNANGTQHCVGQGWRRFRIEECHNELGFLMARVTWLFDENAEAPETRVLFAELRSKIETLIELEFEGASRWMNILKRESSITSAIDRVAAYLETDNKHRQKILETTDVPCRIQLLLEQLTAEIEVQKISQEIQAKSRGLLASEGRIHDLREQLKSLNGELQELESAEDPLTDLRERLEKAELSEEAHAEAQRDLRRLDQMPEHSAEYSMILNYLEVLSSLPWKRRPEKSLDLDDAARILDEDHRGLQKIKRRILEHLAVLKLNPEGHGPILCLVGAPGVGKTSLGKSIARAVSRPFVRVSLGGVHDEASIRGHRRTYIGAMPGNIIQGLKRAGSSQAVFLLDEIDKLGAGRHGDPASALLEVLDPEQNDTFRDHFLGVPFDLSPILFIATANNIDAIPDALRDRCEVIELDAYTGEEKLEIAKQYLVPKQLKSSGVDAEICQLDDFLLSDVIQHHTREAGCRELERLIGSFTRRAAFRIARGESNPISFTREDVVEVLGPRKFDRDIRLEGNLSGVATGLAWTPTGGEILFIEATRVPGQGRLILTGQLGDVMKESAQAALSLVKGRLASLDVDPKDLEQSDIHVHVPAGGIPKDGPSAGVALFSCLMSLFLELPLRGDTAMSGELSLRGLVLPVGGIRDKVIAAANAGIERVILPERNLRDISEIPMSVQKKLELILVNRIEEVLDAALDSNSPRQSKRKSQEPNRYPRLGPQFQGDIRAR